MLNPRENQASLRFKLYCIYMRETWKAVCLFYNPRMRRTPPSTLTIEEFIYERKSSTRKVVISLLSMATGVGIGYLIANPGIAYNKVISVLYEISRLHYYISAP